MCKNSAFLLLLGQEKNIHYLHTVNSLRTNSNLFLLRTLLTFIVLQPWNIIRQVGKGVKLPLGHNGFIYATFQQPIIMNMENMTIKQTSHNHSNLRTSLQKKLWVLTKSPELYILMVPELIPIYLAAVPVVAWFWRIPLLFVAIVTVCNKPLGLGLGLGSVPLRKL